MRINRYLTDKGYCSRREADRLIEAGLVEINGRKAVLGDQVGDSDSVKVKGQLLSQRRSKDIVIAYYKPPGVECTADPEVPENIISAVNYPERVFMIGRLDKFSEGLILLTNMGEIVNPILRSQNEHEKEYIVYLNEDISDATIKKLAKGIDLEIGGDTITTKKCKVERIRSDCIRMVLTEGKNRQIRRMIEPFGLRAKRLKRVRVMHIKLGQLEKGKWRKLTSDEQSELMKRLDSGRPRS